MAEELKLYEVAGYVSATSHVWSGFNLYGNLGFWDGLPADVQQLGAAAWSLLERGTGPLG